MPEPSTPATTRGPTSADATRHLMSSAPPATGLLLWSRAAVLSTVALATGAVAHVQADGRLPGAGVLVTLVAFGALVSAPFLLHPGSTRRIVTLLVVGQSAVHLALSATAGHRGDSVSTAIPRVAPPTAATGERRGSYFDVAYAPTVSDSAGSGLSVPAPLLHAITDVTAHPLMALAHLLAAAACGWWLAMGERALWRLLDLTSRAWSEHAAPALSRWAVAVRAAGLAAFELKVPELAVVVLQPRPESAVRSRSESRRGPPLAA